MEKISELDLSEIPAREVLQKKLPEWILFEQILRDLKPFGRIHHLGHTASAKKNLRFPLLAMSFGNPNPQAPTLALFGGVHGLERIGAQVVLALMRSFSELILWDELLKHSLEKIRLVFFPLINPIGMMEVQRSNPNGVDLMRNSPTEASESTWLVGGQRYSPLLPWFRGHELEPEAKAMIELCRSQIFSAEAAIAVDFHSGFGLQDQVWFPYAKTTEPFPHLAEAYALTESFDRTYPNHFYRIEPQSKNYTTHGDVWDYVYDEYRRQNRGTFLPLTLEMGSWMWVRKNPLQIFSSLGPFNPMKPHRVKRILRRHMTLYDFLLRSTVSHQKWSKLSSEQHNKYSERAYQKWYPTLKR
jgi:hypothetical protein